MPKLKGKSKSVNGSSSRGTVTAENTDGALGEQQQQPIINGSSSSSKANPAKAAVSTSSQSSSVPAAVSMSAEQQAAATAAQHQLTETERKVSHMSCHAVSMHMHIHIHIRVYMLNSQRSCHTTRMPREVCICSGEGSPRLAESVV